MKTLKDLVDELNKLQDEDDFLSKFVIRREDEMDRVFVSKFLLNERTIVYKDLFEYNYRLKGWLICSDLMEMNGAIQKVVVDFLSEFHGEGYEYLYQEKKYNIIIGIGESENEVAVYGKLDDGIYAINSSVTKNELEDDLYQFTENEIEKFQSDLPDNLAHIVELGKVEAK